MSETPLFTPLLNSALLAAGQIKSFPADTVIINEDSYIKSIPIVLKGSIRSVAGAKTNGECWFD